MAPEIKPALAVRSVPEALPDEMAVKPVVPGAAPMPEEAAAEADCVAAEASSVELPEPPGLEVSFAIDASWEAPGIPAPLDELDEPAVEGAFNTKP